MPKATLLIVTRNRAEQLKFGLASVRDQKYDDLEIVVLDDGSTDDTADVVFPFEDVRYHCLRRGGGYRRNPSEVLNFGHLLAKSEVVIEQGGEVCHMNDCVTPLVGGCRPGVVVLARVHNGTLEDMARLASIVKDRAYEFPLDVIPASIRTDAERWKVSRAGSGGFELYCGVERPVPFLFCGAIHRSDFEAVGGYDEKIRGKNDTDLAERLLVRGVRFRFVGNALAFHLKHGKS